MEIQSKNMEFKTVREIVYFAKLTKTEQANLFAKELKIIVKMNSGKDYYIYNDNSKLWQFQNKSCFYSYLCNYLGNTGALIKTVCHSANVLPYCSCEKRRTDCGCDGNLISKLLVLFDNGTYIDLIEKRIIGLIIDPEFEKSLNCTTNTLPIKDGKKINLKTLEITDRVAEDYYSFFCNVGYVKKTPNADKFFQGIMPDKFNREFLRKCVGYILSGDTSARCFFNCYGTGSNGKTVLFGILLKLIMSEFYHTCDKAVFVKSSYSGGASPHLFALLNKRCAIYSEGETADEMDLNMTVLKGISGEDPISARGLYRDPITFDAKCKLVMLTNYVPPLDAEKAIKDRLVYLFFDAEFSDDPKAGQVRNDRAFVDQLKTIYLDEVFTWIVKGSQMYYADNKIVMTDEFQKRTTELLEGEDSIESFFKYKVEITKNDKDFIRKNVLFDIYKDFCDKNSQRCKPRSTLYNRLIHMKCGTTKLNGYDIYRNLKLINYNVDDDEDEYDHGIVRTDMKINVNTHDLEDNRTININVFNKSFKFDNNGSCSKTKVVKLNKSADFKYILGLDDLYKKLRKTSHEIFEDFVQTELNELIYDTTELKESLIKSDQNYEIVELDEKNLFDLF